MSFENSYWNILVRLNRKFKKGWLNFEESRINENVTEVSLVIQTFAQKLDWRINR